ncbi:MAG TPA: hypothetical protein VF292_02865 [Rhodanobacteraceae bacterium]
MPRSTSLPADAIDTAPADPGNDEASAMAVSTDTDFTKAAPGDTAGASTPWPLKDWFDISRRINRADVDDAEAQMMLYAIKDGLDPCDRGCKAQYQAMRAAVREHNRQFPLEPKAKVRRRKHRHRRGHNDDGAFHETH